MTGAFQRLKKEAGENRMGIFAKLIPFRWRNVIPWRRCLWCRRRFWGWPTWCWIRWGIPEFCSYNCADAEMDFIDQSCAWAGHDEDCCPFCNSKLRSRQLSASCDESETYCPDCGYSEGIE